MFVENHICYTFELEIDFFTLKMTLKMTFKQQNNTINGFSSKKSHRKAVLHMLVVLSVTNHIFCLLDIAIEVLTLKMTFNHQNNTRNVFFSQNYIKHTYYTSCYLCLLENIFLIPLTLELTF